MATLTVEGIPAGLLLRLATAAVANGRSVDSEVIISLVRHVRHVRDENARGGGEGAGVVACPCKPWLRSPAPQGLNVSWGDPG